jgi:hypothetical protein
MGGKMYNCYKDLVYTGKYNPTYRELIMWVDMSLHLETLSWLIMWVDMSLHLETLSWLIMWVDMSLHLGTFS